MKSLSKKLSIFLAMVIVFTSTLTIPATATTDETAELPTQTSEESMTFEFSGTIAEEEIQIKPTFGDVDKELVGSGRKTIDVSNQISSRMIANANPNSPSRNPYSYNGSVTVPGQYDIYGLYTVAPGEMIEAVMYAPVKTPVQYVLSIYYLSGSTLYQVDYSTLGTGGSVNFESVGIVNKTPDPIQYAVVVEALTAGNGNDTYNLTVAINAWGYDNYEENNSVYYSGGYVIPNLTSGQYFSYGANLHSATDVEWIRFIVPTNANYSALYFTENNTANVAYELFGVVNGSLYKMTKGVNGEYAVSPGQTYYYRISSTNTSASYPRNYTFEVRTYSPLLQTARWAYTVTVNNGNQVPTQNYSQGGLRYAFLQNQVIEVNVYYYLANGALNTTETDTVTVTMINSAWNPGTYSYNRTAEEDSSGGITYVPLTAGLVYGQVTVQTQYSIWYYDYAPRLTIVSDNYGVLYNDLVFMTTRLN